MGIFNKIKPTTWIYLCLAIIGCVFVVNYLEIFDFKPDLNGDNVYYYALGRAIAAGKGYTNIMFLEETPHSHFPPGYPLFNAGILLFTHSYTALNSKRHLIRVVHPHPFFPPEKDFGELIRRPVNLPVMLYATGITTLLHDCHERNAIYLPHAGSPVLDLAD